MNSFSAPERIATVAAELRRTLTPLLQALAGTPPRPVRLTRGLGLDKSLASRLVQATRAASDLQFLHAVPSPTGLRILLDHAQASAEPVLLRATGHAVAAFESLLDALPGGRQALDARMGETLGSIRERREQTARQASFKAQSFLFGHYCETLCTALFLVPSADGEHIDALEVHRRLGLQRLAAGTTLPLLSVQAQGPAPLAGTGPVMTSVDGDTQTRRPHDFLVAEGSSVPLPELQVVEEGSMSTFVLAPDAPDAPGGAPARLTSAFRILRADRLQQRGAYNVVRNYMLHTPCRTLVRDVYLARGLWPDAWPQIDFYLPGPTGTPLIQPEPGRPHLRRVNLTARIEQLPPGFDLDGVPDQAATVGSVLARAGVADTAFRGWRCRMTYPVPLIEMQVAFRFGGA